MSLRQDRKGLAKELKKMPDTQVYQFIFVMCNKFGNDVKEEAKKILHKEFGFGKERQQRFADELEKIIKEKAIDKVGEVAKGEKIS